MISFRRALSLSVESKHHLNNTQNDLLKSYLRKTSNLNICINNPDFATKVAQTLEKDLEKCPIVLEASPGRGILSEKLLKHTKIERLRVFEHIKSHHKHLNKLSKQYRKRLELIDQQILDLSNGNYRMLNITRDEFLKFCFSDIEVSPNWQRNELTDKPVECSPSYKFIAAISPFLAREFMSFFVYSLSQYDSFFFHGPNEYYLFLPVSNFKQMISKPSKNLKYYTAFTVHVNSMFDYTEIDLYSPDLKGVERMNIDDKVYSIISKDNFTFTNDRVFKTHESFVFLKFKPKPIINQLTSEYLFNYLIFVKQSFIKPTNNAIQYYEHHFPGCGIDLIQNNISYFKTLGDLKSDEMFTIFKLLYNKPLYKSTIFHELANL